MDEVSAVTAEWRRARDEHDGLAEELEATPRALHHPILEAMDGCRDDMMAAEALISGICSADLGEAVTKLSCAVDILRDEIRLFQVSEDDLPALGLIARIMAEVAMLAGVTGVAGLALV